MGRVVSNISMVVSLRLIGRLLLRCLVGKHGTILLTSALAVLIGAGAYLSLVYDHTGSGGADQGAAYSLGMVDSNLAYDPGSWLGRTIQVQGEVVPCLAMPSAGGGPCAELTQDFAWPDGYSHFASGTPNPLTVVSAGLDPLRSVLRQVPLLGRLAPAPQVLHWGAVATYRVQLTSVPGSTCGLDPCVEARLLDSAP